MVGDPLWSSPACGHAIVGVALDDEPLFAWAMSAFASRGARRGPGSVCVERWSPRVQVFSVRCRRRAACVSPKRYSDLWSRIAISVRPRNRSIGPRWPWLQGPDFIISSSRTVPRRWL